MLEEKKRKTKIDLIHENERLARVCEKLNRELCDMRSAYYLETERLKMVIEQMER